MAEVKDVVFEISDSSNSNNKKITVSYKLAFTPAEAGKFYKVVINLFGDDTGESPVVIGGLPQSLYTFTFGQFPFLRNYQTVTAQAGEKSYSVSREVSTEKLDEDPGKELVEVAGKPGNIPPIPPFKVALPRPDEVYAVVSLTIDSRSETQKITL